MDKETKAQAIYADMVRQAGDAAEELERLVNSTYECEMPKEGKPALSRAIQTLNTLIAFIQGIQATQGLMQSQPIESLVPKEAKDPLCTCIKNTARYGNAQKFIICDHCAEKDFFRIEEPLDYLGVSGPYKVIIDEDVNPEIIKALLDEGENKQVVLTISSIPEILKE